VAKRLQQARLQLPNDVEPVIEGQISAAEILLIGLRSAKAAPQDPTETAIELRHVAEARIRPRLTSLPGVSHVSIAGGLRRQCEVIASLDRLAAFDVTLSELASAIDQAGDMAGLLETGVGTVRLEAIAEIEIAQRHSQPILIKDVAAVRFGAVLEHDERSGEKGAAGSPAVVLAVQLQPETDPLAVSRSIDERLGGLRQELTASTVIQRLVTSGFEGPIQDLVKQLQLTLPPEVALQRGSSKQLGDFLKPSAEFAVKLFGPDLGELRQSAQDASARLAKLASVAECRIEPSLSDPYLQVQIDADRVARLGLSAREVAETVQIASSGFVLGDRLMMGDQRIALVVRCDRSLQADPESLGSIRLRTSTGEMAAVRDVAQLVQAITPDCIHRENGTRMLLILCSLRGDRAKASKEIREALAPMEHELRGRPGCRTEFSD
jgi:Cu/Ag efflux pump CusA